MKTLALERLEVERTAGRASQFPSEEAASAYALDQYRFYECARCHKPYFGGDRNCAPDVAQPQQPGWVMGRKLGFFGLKVLRC